MYHYQHQNRIFLLNAANRSGEHSHKNAAASAADQLRTHGIVIPAIRYPTVKRGEARLRAALMATHTHDQLAFAAHLIGQSLQEISGVSGS